MDTSGIASCSAYVWMSRASLYTTVRRGVFEDCFVSTAIQLDVLCMGQTTLITVAYHGRSNQEHRLILLEFGTKHMRCSECYDVFQVHENSMTTEIPEGWAGWKAARYYVILRTGSKVHTRSNCNTGCCITGWIYTLSNRFGIKLWRWSMYEPACLATNAACVSDENNTTRNRKR